MTIDEARKVLEDQGYLVELFGLGKKKENEKSADPEFLHYRNTSPYAGLIWKILEQINIDYNKSITKAQAINYIKELLPAIKDNPKSEVYEKVLFDVINAIN